MPTPGEISEQDRAGLVAYGRRSITQGSKSFALASFLFGEQMQADAHMLYSWCRYCDDVIDGQTLGVDAPDAQMTGAERQAQLQRLRSLTEQSLRGEVTGEPAFDAFADVARRHEIPAIYPLDLLNGFARDADEAEYQTLDDTLQYCYGVAGVVGIMMAIIMGVPRSDEDTLDRACDLGLAFQITNICRDLIDDANAGRVYAPADMLIKQGVKADSSGVLDPNARDGLWRTAIALLDIADDYYASASQGVRRLPPRAAAAVAAARNIYRAIGAQIRRHGPDVWRERVAISSPRKTVLALSGVITGAPSSIFLRGVGLKERGALWDRRVIRRGADCF